MKYSGTILLKSDYKVLQHKQLLRKDGSHFYNIGKAGPIKKIYSNTARALSSDSDESELKEREK